MRFVVVAICAQAAKIDREAQTALCQLIHASSFTMQSTNVSVLLVKGRDSGARSTSASSDSCVVSCHQNGSCSVELRTARFEKFNRS